MRNSLSGIIIMLLTSLMMQESRASLNQEGLIQEAANTQLTEEMESDLGKLTEAYEKLKEALKSGAMDREEIERNYLKEYATTRRVLALAHQYSGPLRWKTHDYDAILSEISPKILTELGFSVPEKPQVQLNQFKLDDDKNAGESLKINPENFQQAESNLINPDNQEEIENDDDNLPLNDESLNNYLDTHDALKTELLDIRDRRESVRDTLEQTLDTYFYPPSLPLRSRMGFEKIIPEDVFTKMTTLTNGDLAIAYGKEEDYRPGISRYERVLREREIANMLKDLEAIYNLAGKGISSISKKLLKFFRKTVDDFERNANRLYVNPNNVMSRLVDMKEIKWLYEIGQSYKRRKKHALSRYEEQEKQEHAAFVKRNKVEREEGLLDDDTIPLQQDQLKDQQNLGQQQDLEFEQKQLKEDDFLQKPQEKDPKWNDFLNSMDYLNSKKIKEIDENYNELEKEKDSYNRMNRLFDYAGFYGPYYKNFFPAHFKNENELNAYLLTRKKQHNFEKDVNWLKELAEKKGYKGQIYNSEGIARDKDYEKALESHMGHSQFKPFSVPSEIVDEQKKLAELPMSVNDKRLMNNLYSSYLILTHESAPSNSFMFPDTTPSDIIQGRHLAFYLGKSNDKNFPLDLNSRIEGTKIWGIEGRGIDGTSGENRELWLQRNAFFFRIMYPRWIKILQTRYGYSGKNVVLSDQSGEHSISFTEAQKLYDKLDDSYGNDSFAEKSFFDFYEALSDEEKLAVENLAKAVKFDETFFENEKNRIRHLIYEARRPFRTMDIHVSTDITTAPDLSCRENNVLCNFSHFLSVAKKKMNLADGSFYYGKKLLPYEVLDDYIRSVIKLDVQKDKVDIFSRLQKMREEKGETPGQITAAVSDDLNEANDQAIRRY